jgi:hypothetical protein
MKLRDIEDAGQLVTKEYFEAKLDAKFEKLKRGLLEQIIASERAGRNLVFGVYGMIVGTYALIIAAIYINHFWPGVSQ